MEILAIKYTINSVGDVKLINYLLERPEEEAFVEQLKELKSLGAYDIRELEVKIINNAVFDYEKNVVRHPTLGLKMHISKIVNDDRYGKVLRDEPIDMDYWLAA